MIGELCANLDPAECIVTHDAGSPRDQLTPFWRATEPLSYLGWGKTTQLGYGLGLAMGAKLARPDKVCVNVWGDAAIGFTGMDFETAVRERLPILSILLNNFSMAIELPIMKAAQEKYGSCDISGNYADFAKALGGYGERVTEPARGRRRHPSGRRADEGRDAGAAGVHHREGPHLLGVLRTFRGLSPMPKRLLFNAFTMNCVSHIQHGLWVRDDTRQLDYTSLDPWVELARLLERGRFDAMFLADVVGAYDLYRGSRDPSVVEAMQIPVNDPALLIPAMAHATTDLGFAFTSSVLQTHPFTFARQATTLDHLTKGRVAWNVVTSYLPNAGANLGYGGLPRPRRALRPGRGVPGGRSTSCGRAAGRTTPWCATGAGAGTPIRPRSTPSTTRAASTTWSAPTCPSPRRSARRCCSRPAPPTGAGTSPPPTPSASSWSPAGAGRSSAGAIGADVRRRAVARGRQPR